MTYCYNALWMDNAQVSQSSSQDILGIGIRNGREAPTDTCQICSAVVLSSQGGGIALPHPESPYVMHLTSPCTQAPSKNKE